MKSEPIEWREVCKAWDGFKASRGDSVPVREARQEGQQDSYAVLGRAVAGLMEEDASFRVLVISLLCKGIFSPPGSRI
ncbi:MAG TPA: hypothetical protein VN822_06155 [Candidatus Acidoferrales bacterium]|nr:hypothetical protein [Candidatus Acidoferrales bacterium]